MSHQNQGRLTPQEIHALALPYLNHPEEGVQTLALFAVNMCDTGLQTECVQEAAELWSVVEPAGPCGPTVLRLRDAIEDKFIHWLLPTRGAIRAMRLVSYLCNWSSKHIQLNHNNPVLGTTSASGG